MASSPPPAETRHDVDNPPHEVWWRMGPGSAIQPLPLAPTMGAAIDTISTAVGGALAVVGR